MGRKPLHCFVVMYGYSPYRPFGSVITIHAASRGHAIRLLNDKSLRFPFKVFPGLYVRENQKCSPEKIPTGDHCYYHLIAKPTYDLTPLGGMTPNSPEWMRRVEQQPDLVDPKREALIQLIRQRKDIGDPE